jgi:hypothetical protein
VSRLLLTTAKIDPKRAIPREEQERTSKIFVGGVSQEATEEDFTKFFKQFGRVVDATLMMDKETGRPRGFGFVTFDGDAAVDATLRQPLQILGKPIEVKRAQPRGNMRDDDGGDKKFGRNNKFNNRDQGGNGNAGGYDNQMNSQPQGGNGNMTPAMMAQYWQRMQQYFQQMQQNLAQQQVGGGGMAGGMGPMGGMNPMQMQQMQQQMMGGGMNRNTGSPNPQNMMGNPGGMNPMQMQQMMQANAGANPGSFAPNQGTCTPPSPSYSPLTSSQTNSPSNSKNTNSSSAACKAATPTPATGTAAAACTTSLVARAAAAASKAILAAGRAAPSLPAAPRTRLSTPPPALRTQASPARIIVVEAGMRAGSGISRMGAGGARGLLAGSGVRVLGFESGM